MKKNLLLVVFILSAGFTFAQKSAWNLWSTNKAVATETIRKTAYSENQKLLQFDAVQFKQTLANAPQKTLGQAGVEIQLPNVKGQLEKFVIWESSNFEPALQAQFPEIRAYVGKGITDPAAVLNFSFDSKGIKTMVFRATTGTEFIEPYTKDNSVYVVFDSATRIKGQLPFACGAEDFSMSQNLSGKANSTNRSSAQSYKTMRLALSCTAEYTTYHGGTVAGALAAMNATMTRCNAIFEKDLAVKLLLIANNNLVIYTDAAADPYSDAAAGSAGAWNAELMNNLHTTLGDSAFDIGHLFGADGGGGNAGCIGCVCNNTLAVGGGSTTAYKGSGYTSPVDAIPEGDNFDIDYVAHEMGHQLGANHTFAYGGINGTENSSVNIEPGSGSTIMSYAGIGGNGTDMQPHSDDYFAYKSIAQIQTNMGTKTCPISTSLAVTNPKPTVAVQGSTFTIPINTPFRLTGSGTGTSGEVLTYCWEQNDDATVISTAASIPSPTKTDGPNFRSRPPSLSPVRYFPQLSDVLAGNLAPTWETLSTVARTLTFAFTVRDNVLGGGQTNSAATTVNVVNGGAGFAITNPATDNTSWTPGTSQTITWNVAGTTTNGINTANVNILFSTDGGANFTVYLANTPNDGTETITLPNSTSPSFRIMVEAVGNIFYAVSKNIGLGYTFTSACTTYTNTTVQAIPDGPDPNNSIAGPTLTSTINIPVSFTLADVNVRVNVTHAWIRDLVTRLKHPDGTEVILGNRICNSQDGFNILFNDGSPAIVCAAPITSGTFTPNQPLSALNNKIASGNWSLLINDFFQVDTGNLNSWSIEVCGLQAVLSTQANQLTDFTIYPNPSKGNFNIQFDNRTSNEIKVNVYDMRGRTIFENNYSNEATFNENIQLNNAQSGVYLVSVTDGNQKIVKRIVIE